MAPAIFIVISQNEVTPQANSLWWHRGGQRLLRRSIIKFCKNLYCLLTNSWNLIVARRIIIIKITNIYYRHNHTSFRTETKLTSVLELRREIEESCQKSLRDTFAQHVFVGCISPHQALIQHSTKLYLCNTKKIFTELLYQLIIYNFENFACYNFSSKISIYELAILALNMSETGWTPEDGEKTELSKRITEILIEKGPMLEQYFSIKIDEEGNVYSIPIILGKYLINCYVP